MRRLLALLGLCRAVGLRAAAEALRARFVSRPPIAACRATRSSSPIGAPRNMPPEMAQRVAAALAMELQAYGIVATVQPATRRSR